MIPDFREDGTLPPGVHLAEWAEFAARFGTNPHRRQLLAGLREGLELLAAAGSTWAYIDGSYVTAKDFPADFDACWDLGGVDPSALDPVFLNFDNGRVAQKKRFLGEFFPAQLPEGASGKTFVEFFQIDKNTGNSKGIVAISIKELLS